MKNKSKLNLKLLIQLYIKKMTNPIIYNPELFIELVASKLRMWTEAHL